MSEACLLQAQAWPPAPAQISSPVNLLTSSPRHRHIADSAVQHIQMHAAHADALEKACSVSKALEPRHGMCLLHCAADQS